MAHSVAAVCHPGIGLKFMLLSGFDPTTFGQGENILEWPPNQRATYMVLNI
jgi:hypothetical protein